VLRGIEHESCWHWSSREGLANLESTERKPHFLAKGCKIGSGGDSMRFTSAGSKALGYEVDWFLQKGSEARSPTIVYTNFGRGRGFEGDGVAVGGLPHH
jgi:hypothetical protein